jgi:hypothetical protein
MTIQEGIDHSMSHDTITCIEFMGDSGEALSEISRIWDGKTDYRMRDHEGIDTLDVWGWTDDTPDDDQDWRLNIRFS